MKYKILIIALLLMACGGTDVKEKKMAEVKRPDPNDQSLVYNAGILGRDGTSEFFSFGDFPIFNIDYSVFEPTGINGGHPAKNHYSCVEIEDKYAYVHDMCEGRATPLRILYVVNKATGKANMIRCERGSCTFTITENNLWIMENDKIHKYDLGGNEIQETVSLNIPDMADVQSGNLSFQNLLKQLNLL